MAWTGSASEDRGGADAGGCGEETAGGGPVALQPEPGQDGPAPGGQQQARVGDAAQGGGHGLPRLLALLVQQRVEEALAELGRRPDGEDEPAVDGMAVGRDDPPGDDVGAVGEAVARGPPPRGWRRCPCRLLPRSTRVAPAVEHPHAAEGDRHRLGELEGHRGRRFVDGLAVAWVGRQQLRVGAGRARADEREAPGRDRGRRRPASRGVRLAPGGPWEEGAGARRRAGEEPDHGEAGEVEDVVRLAGERRRGRWRRRAARCRPSPRRGRRRRAAGPRPVAGCPG